MIFLDTYYYYSWFRIYRYLNIRSIIRKYRPKTLLIIEDIQLSRFRNLKWLYKKFERIVNLDSLTNYLKEAINKRYKRLDFGDLISSGIIDEEDVGILEYLFIVNTDTGVIDPENIRPGCSFKLNRERVRKLIYMGTGLVPLHPEQYVKYLRYKLACILKIKNVEFINYSNIKPIIPPDSLLMDIENRLCKSKGISCPIVSRGKSIRHHREDLELALAVSTYAVRKGVSIVIVGVPYHRLECFNHTISFLREEYNHLRELLIHLTRSL